LENNQLTQSGKSSEKLDVSELIRLIETLRGDNGCPWDRTQTPKSMTLYLVEEVYELLDAIHSRKTDHICEELGDVLFQIIFLVLLYEERGDFYGSHVIGQIIKKMTHRHPHVFNPHSDSVKDIEKQWKRLKISEKNLSEKTSILDSVPPTTPALIRAYRISKRAASTGFDWDDLSGVIEKVEEEWSEFKSALQTEDINRIALELGDLFFTLVNVARMISIHPESALLDAILKFENRFKQMELQVSETGESLDTISKKEMNLLWERIKKSSQ
jgi:tetrapyrrole methylase family protein/MazG family protein